MSFDVDALIRKAKDQVVEPVTGDHEVVIAGELVVFRFTKMEPMGWRELVGAYPPRSGVVRDMNLGYNYDKAPEGFPNVAVVDGDNVTVLDGEQWRALFGMLESPDIFAISTLLWGMHEFDPAQAVVEAKKALTGGKSLKPQKR